MAVHHSGGVEDAEDAVQDTFVKLLNTKKEFCDDRHVLYWLIRVCINECHSIFRHPWKKGVIPLDKITNVSMPENADYTDLKNAINKLNSKDRSIIYLYYFEGYSAKETAEILNMTETAVTSRMRRIRGKLGNLLEGA
ncbi:MAG: sigma-70 family RNA polymerase sigma factor [Firmicutes bacterium]|nr:sigma-70 family RNA polymerase sigma factor [Bacillota bacterium]